jgi:hypothetical protein
MNFLCYRHNELHFWTHVANVHIKVNIQCKEWRQKDCVKHEKGIFNNNVIPTTPFNNVTGKYDQQIHIRRNEIQFIRDLSTDCEFETVHCFSSTRCILHMGARWLRVTFPLNVQLLRNECWWDLWHIGYCCTGSIDDEVSWTLIFFFINFWKKSLIFSRLVQDFYMMKFEEKKLWCASIYLSLITPAWTSLYFIFFFNFLVLF